MILWASRTKAPNIVLSCLRNRGFLRRQPVRQSFFLLSAIGIHTERGEFIFGFPYFVNFQAARGSSYFILYLGFDIIRFVGGVLTIAAPFVKRKGLRLLAVAELFSVAEAIWLFISTSSTLEWNFTLIALWVLVCVIFATLSCAPSIACAVVLLLCDADRLRNKKLLLSLF